MHPCKQETIINKLNREQGEFKGALNALIQRFDRHTKVQIALGVILISNTLVVLGFLITFWVENVKK